MRIETITLGWFRGAAEETSLEPRSKSIVVYGENGSGKSSFVDAVEYVLNHGKIGHLSHEYSGRHQEKGTINTHRPDGQESVLGIKFKDGSELQKQIRSDGSCTSCGGESVAMDTWDYRRTVLRQDEVAEFIRFRKGDKYSALLPLLGLGEMEVAAENLRQLAKSIETRSKLREMKGVLASAKKKREATFEKATDEKIVGTIGRLHRNYCTGSPETTEPLSQCDELEIELEARIARSTADQRLHVCVQHIAKLDLKAHVKDVRSTSLKLADAMGPLINEKLEVLESTDTYLDGLEDEREISCPACGRRIPVEQFREHVADEKERLKDAIKTFDARKIAIGNLCETLNSLKTNAADKDAKPWHDELEKGRLAGTITYLDGLDAETIRASCKENDLQVIEEKLLPLIEAAVLTSKHAPPDAQQLSTDQETIEVGRAVIESMQQAETLARNQALVSFVQSLENGVREEIRARSQRVIDEISSDIQTMWSILHPGEAIEDVKLYVPDEDKAIDIGLKFYGIQQESPRLTLSEGNRNSLGLCIFLAMARREADNDRPLILDDVVTSLDRNHRGMIVELLEREFSDRQVLLLTHDRDWFIELRQLLDGSSWMFRALMPYDEPSIGIRWSERTTAFDDARAQLKDVPHSAGNTARKIMDMELAIRAERMRVKLPYLHREKNDHRVAHDFLTQMISDGDKCFRRKGEREHEPYSEAIQILRDTDKLLVAWGNRSSHTFDVVQREAAKLIEECEKMLELFNCRSCSKPVHKLHDNKAEFVQCECGKLRWRYGKV